MGLETDGPSGVSPQPTSLTDLKGIEEGILVVFIPRDDDTFASTSHSCLHVVSTPDGDWLFNRRLTESHGNTPQADYEERR